MKQTKPFDSPVYVTRPLFPPLKEVSNLLEDVWESQWLSNFGDQHQQFKKELKKVLKTPHLSLFNNGTIALLTALRALEIRGEVITTPFTFPATPHSITWAGSTPVFVDVLPDTLNINPEEIRKAITPKTTAILAVHVFGTPCDVESIDAIAKENGLKVIYDAAHAFGLELDHQGIGNWGDISMFSFHPTKLFHTAEGGALTYQNRELGKNIYLLKNFGILNEEEVVLPGINGKMNEMQAGIGRVVLRHLDDERERRQRVKKIYDELLSNIEGIDIMSPRNNQVTQESLQYYAIKVNKELYGLSRDQLHEKLKQFNVFTRKYFYPLCSNYPHYRSLPSSSPENLPVANQIVSQILTLPFYGSLALDSVKKISQIIEELSPHA